MKPYHLIFKHEFPSAYCTEGDLLNVLGRSGGFHNKINTLVSHDVLERVKRGFYLVGQNYRSGPLDLFAISNLLYGPSYVSLSSALSHYGLIPEAAKNITAVAWQKTKSFQTAIGYFEYHKVTAKAFFSGVISQDGNPTVHGKCHTRHLIACPEKAILDTIYLQYLHLQRPNLQKCGESVLDWLTQSLRVEGEDIRQLDFALMQGIAQCYNRHFSGLIAELIALVK